MSLLMDALRRAEAEKKHQQARADANRAAADKSTPPATTRPVDARAAGSEDVTIQVEQDAVERAQAAFSDVAKPDDTIADLGDISDSFTLDDGDDSRVMQSSAALELEPLDGADIPVAADASEESGGTTRGASVRVDQTQTMPSARGLENDLNAYFDQSQSVEMPRSAALGDVTLEDVASHTVAGARTVFSAGERPRSKRVFIATAIVAFVIVLGIGGVGLFYAQRSPGPHYLPPPTVADGVERPEMRELPVVPLEPPATASSGALARIETQVTTSASPPGVLAAARPSVAPPVPEPPIIEPPATETVPANTPPVAVETQVVTAPPPTTAPAVAATSGAAAVRQRSAEPRARPTDQGVGAGQLRINRTLRPAIVNSDVAQAYQAFQAGDLERAANGYTAALAREPEQRDALLGLAAVALARGELESAYLHYARVLKAHPRDSVASAALVGLTGDPRGQNAARLRLMLDQHRDQPYLHFTLGNWYARQGRWGDAQQSYFDAFRFDETNADYAYNLAISLDHIGQSSAALEYYQKSLALADRSAANFNPASVLERISALTAAAAPRAASPP